MVVWWVASFRHFPCLEMIFGFSVCCFDLALFCLVFWFCVFGLAFGFDGFVLDLMLA